MINKINSVNLKSKKTPSNITKKIYNHRKDVIQKGLDWGCIYFTKKIMDTLIINDLNLINIIDKNSIANIQIAAKQTIKNNKKLKQKKLKLIYLNENNFKRLKPELQSNNHIILIKEGYNAAFFAKTNKIFMPEKNLQLSVFHEIGHAINYNCSKLWLKLYRISNLSMPLTYLTFSTQLFKNNKNEEKKSSKKAAFISTSPLLPNLLEEGVASIKGEYEAKKLLSKDLYKKILKNNGLSFLAYFLKYGFTYITFKMFFDLKNLIPKK